MPLHSAISYFLFLLRAFQADLSLSSPLMDTMALSTQKKLIFFSTKINSSLSGACEHNNYCPLAANGALSSEMQD